jgi:hypothetical protein
MSAIISLRKDGQYQGGTGSEEALPDLGPQAPGTDIPAQYYPH